MNIGERQVLGTFVLTLRTFIGVVISYFVIFWFILTCRLTAYSLYAAVSVGLQVKKIIIIL